MQVMPPDHSGGPSRQFILRPVATTLLMIAILLAGVLGYRFLPVSALPEVDYPTIQVVTLYPGASPDVVTSSITAPLERQFGQMSGLKQMASQSAGGASVVTLQFQLSLPLDVAEQEVQAAINSATNLLPNDLPNPPVYSKVNPADPPIMTLAVTTSSMPLTQVQDMVETRVAQKISQVSGVGLVTLSGGQRPAVRVKMNAQALAALGERPVTLGRELTKQFEELATCPAQALAAWLAADANRAKGEFAVLVHPQPKAASAGLDLRVLQLLLPELPLKTAVRLAAEITGQSRNALYDAALALQRA